MYIQRVCAARGECGQLGNAMASERRQGRGAGEGGRDGRKLVEEEEG